MRIIGNANARQVVIVETGQHGYRNNLGMRACRSFGILHHRAPTGCMNCQDRGLKAVQRLHRFGHSVGYIMQFKVEENRQTQFGNFMHTVMAIGAEKFEAQLYASNMVLDPLGEIKRGDKIGRVDGDLDGVAHIVPPIFGEAGGGTTRLTLSGTGRAAVSSVITRRFIRQCVPRCQI